MRKKMLLGQIKLFQVPILEIWVRALEPQCTKLCRKGSVIWHLLWRNLCWSSHQKIFPKREWENGGFISRQGFSFPAPQILNFSEYWEEWCATGRVANVDDITDITSCKFKEEKKLEGKPLLCLFWMFRRWESAPGVVQCKLFTKQFLFLMYLVVNQSHPTFACVLRC